MAVVYFVRGKLSCVLNKDGFIMFGCGMLNCSSFTDRGPGVHESSSRDGLGLQSPPFP